MAVKKWVTITVVCGAAGCVYFHATDHYNERSGERCPNRFGLILPEGEFDALAAEHGLTRSAFPFGTAVRVHEPA